MKSLVSITTSSLMLLLALIDTISSLPIIDADDVIEQTCKRTQYYDICASTLRSDPHSSGADVKGLALIMAGVVGTKAKETLIHINNLLNASPQHDYKKALYSCAAYYDIGIITTDVPLAIDALKAGDYKFAGKSANDAANEADFCEKSFKGTSPLTQMNKLVHDLSAVAAAIIKILLF